MGTKIALPKASEWTLDTGLEAVGESGIRLAHGGITDNCQLMLHMEGSNGGITFTDNSPKGHTLVAQGNANTSTAQKKFGSSSGYFDGVGDFLRIVPQDAFNFAGDFTIDCWVYITDNTKTMRFFGFGHDNGASGYGELFTLGGGTNAGWGAGTRLNFVVNDGTGFTQIVTNAVTLNNNTWYHVAAVRSGSTVQLYLDGAAVSGGSGTFTQDLRPSKYTIGGVIYGHYVGCRANTSTFVTEYMFGYIDELRVVNGTAMWTSNFTPPISSYYRFLTTSPLAESPWISVPVGTLDGAAPINIIENAIATHDGISTGSIAYQYAINNGAYNGAWLTLANLKVALAGQVITNTTNSVRIKAQFTSSGTTQTDISGLGAYVDAVVGGGGDMPAISNVRFGTVFDNGTKVGTLDLLTGEYILQGHTQDNGAIVGRYQEALESKYEYGVQYGVDGTSRTGTKLFSAGAGSPLEVIELESTEVIEV